MIHFFDPSNPRMASKVPDIAKQVDILLGNLEDAIPTERKVDAREGLIKIARDVDFGEHAALDAGELARQPVDARRRDPAGAARSATSST